MGFLSIFQDVYNYMFAKNANKTPNLGEDVRLVVKSAAFDKQLRSAKPFLVAGLVVWPTYWLYRGLVWHRIRNKEPLPLYIRKTFYHTKVIELAIVLAGIIVAIRSTQKSLKMQVEVHDVAQKK